MYASLSADWKRVIIQVEILNGFVSVYSKTNGPQCVFEVTLWRPKIIAKDTKFQGLVC